MAEERFRVDTIAGWCLRYASSYPGLSGLSQLKPTAQQWAQVYPAAIRVLKSEALRGVISETYDGLFVDEYQGCTKTQHRVILALAEVLPCCILSDPLQGIFDFNEALVAWKTDVTPHFEKLPPLREPHRWRDNAPLGVALVTLREKLLAGQVVDWRSAPFQWRPIDGSSIDERLRNQCAVCESAYNVSGSVVALRRWPSECYSVGAMLEGRYTCMEEMDCKDLFAPANAIEEAKGLDRCLAVLDFAEKCVTGIATTVQPMRQALGSGNVQNVDSSSSCEAGAAAVVGADDAGVTTAGAAIIGISGWARGPTDRADRVIAGRTLVVAKTGIRLAVPAARLLRLRHADTAAIARFSLDDCVLATGPTVVGIAFRAVAPAEQTDAVVAGIALGIAEARVLVLVGAELGGPAGATGIGGSGQDWHRHRVDRDGLRLGGIEDVIVAALLAPGSGPMVRSPPCSQLRLVPTNRTSPPSTSSA